MFADRSVSQARVLKAGDAQDTARDAHSLEFTQGTLGTIPAPRLRLSKALGNALSEAKRGGESALDLSNTRLLRADVDGIVACLHQPATIHEGVAIQNITELSLSHSYMFTPKTLCPLLEALACNCTRLGSLSVDGCGVDDACADGFVGFLRDAGASGLPLHALRLRYNDLTARGCRKLLDARDRYCPWLGIDAQGNPAPEALILRLGVPSGAVTVPSAFKEADVGSVVTTEVFLHSSQSITYALPQQSELLVLNPVPDTQAPQPHESLLTQDLSPYLDSPVHNFQAELREQILLFIRETFQGIDSIDETPLEERATPDLCMLCINAIQLKVQSLSTAASRDITRLLSMKDMLERSGLPPISMTLTSKSTANEALTVAIYLIQSLIQVITGQVTIS